MSATEIEPVAPPPIVPARTATGTFAPGQTGNPGGRLKVEGRIRELAREHTEEAIATLAACMKDEDGRVRVQAAIALLDRGYGRPAQQVHLETDGASVMAGLVILPAEKPDA